MMPVMDIAEASKVAEARLRQLRGLTYSRLAAEWLDRPRSEYATAPSGRRYQLEIEAVWDDRPNANLRVWVLVDDGGSSATRPLHRDFIVAPDGSFVGE
ncbi:MAG: hypothetical protein QOJ12_2879 [Thermoleophilales bacterium]|jgi:hypothetical protein|nr:hypothetical protein [Thermoleophilales bacterium]